MDRAETTSQIHNTSRPVTSSANTKNQPPWKPVTAAILRQTGPFPLHINDVIKKENMCFILIQKTLNPSCEPEALAGSEKPAD